MNFYKPLKKKLLQVINKEKATSIKEWEMD